MRNLLLFILASSTSPVLMQTAHAAGIDTVAAPDIGNTVIAAESTDGELILDDNDNSILPVEKKNPVQAVTPEVKTSGTDTAGPPSQSAASAEPEKPARPSGQKITDEELILDGGEERILGREPPGMPAKPLPSAGTLSAADSTTAPSTAADQPSGKPLSLPEPGAFADSAAAAAEAVSIENPKAINFARNLNEYRSPRLAMLMSLVLPGSGQIYAKSNLWAAAFGAIEAALVSTGLVLSAKAGKIKKQAREYADEHFDTARFRQYLDDLKQYLPNLPPTVGIDPADKADSIFNKVIFLTGEDSTFFTDARNKNDAYYNYLDRGGSAPFVRGWDDIAPEFTPAGFVIQGDDTTRFGVMQGDTSYLVFLISEPSHTMYGMSAHQQHYSDMLRDSRNWSDFSRNTFLSLLINHIASSIMAGIAAKRHNDELLGRESFWQRIDFQHQYVFTGSETAPGYALQVEF